MLSPETLEWLRQTARQGHSYSLAHFDAIARLDALEARVALLEHVEADEPDDDEPQTLHSVALKMVDTLEQLGVIPEIRGTLRRAILEPMEPAAAAAAPVATDDELTRVFDTYHLWRDSRRATYNLGRAHGTPPAVVVALQEAEAVLTKIVRDVWGRSNWLGRQAFAPLPTIRAALQLLGQPAPAAAPESIEPEAQPAEDAALAEGLVKKIAFTAGCGDGTSRAVIREVAAWLDCRGQHDCSLWLREQCAASQEGDQ
jgi:hypothetical protein